MVRHYESRLRAACDGAEILIAPLAFRADAFFLQCVEDCLPIRCKLRQIIPDHAAAGSLSGFTVFQGDCPIFQSDEAFKCQSYFSAFPAVPDLPCSHFSIHRDDPVGQDRFHTFRFYAHHVTVRSLNLTPQIRDFMAVLSVFRQILNCHRPSGFLIQNIFLDGFAVRGQFNLDFRMAGQFILPDLFQAQADCRGLGCIAVCQLSQEDQQGIVPLSRLNRFRIRQRPFFRYLCFNPAIGISDSVGIHLILANCHCRPVIDLIQKDVIIAFFAGQHPA